MLEAMEETIGLCFPWDLRNRCWVTLQVGALQPGEQAGEQPGEVLKDQAILMTVFDGSLLVPESLNSLLSIFIALYEPSNI